MNTAKISFQFLILALTIATSYGNGFGIIGGKPVSLQDQHFFKHQVYVSSVYPPYKTCGGTIFNNKMVLTVAHCVHTLNASNVFIRGGTLDPFRGGVVKDILQIDVHPEFNKTKNEHENDVAVLHLDSNLEFNEKIGAIRLADYTDESLYHDYSLKVNISGM